MFAHTWITAAAVAAAPVPGAHERALELYEAGAYLAAADAATEGYLPPGVPAARRLRSARLAQEALSRAHDTSKEPRPDYLCRALDVLDATTSLAVEVEDIRLHGVLADALRAKLAARHPAYPCEVGTELRPVLAVARNRKPPPPATQAPPPEALPAPEISAPIRETPRPQALRITGEVSIMLGVVALATMTAGLVVRARAGKAAAAIDDAQQQQAATLRPQQARDLATLAATDNIGKQLAIAGGVSSGFFIVLGAALFGHSRTLERARVAPMAGFGRAGFFVEGKF